MQEIDVVDEATVNGSPMVIYRAVVNELAGLTHWWMPVLESKPEAGATRIDHEGAVFDALVHGEKRTMTTSNRVTKIREGELIQVEIWGDFRGVGTWTFEPMDNKTRVRFRWKVRPHRMAYVFAYYFVDMGKRHSEVMRKGFEALERSLEKSELQSAT